MTLRGMRTLACLLALSLAGALPLGAAPRSSGKLLGVVVADGTPQLGATVVITAEQGPNSAPTQVLTNDHGLFTAGLLLPGQYSVRVTLAGFLPALEQHVRIGPRQTTLLKIELDSVFASLNRLRRPPDHRLDSDEWAWVLRTSAATRPVLRWTDGEVVLDQQPSQAEEADRRKPHGRVELTTGARRPGSIANPSDSPATSFVYDQSIGHISHLLLAGQASYEHSTAAGSFATEWLPSGRADVGPVTTLVLRQSKLGPDGPTFRAARLEQDEQIVLGDRVEMRFGAQYILASLGRSTASLRPRAKLTLHASPTWQAAFILASAPLLDADQATDLLQGALDSLDAFPTFMLRDGHPVLEQSWHEELALEHTLGPGSSLVAAVFRDRSPHTAVFGDGEIANRDFLQDSFSDAFAYDGGQSNSWGTRVALEQKLSENFSGAVVYSWAGALTLEGQPIAPDELRDILTRRNCHSLGARVTGRLSRLGTQFVAGYNWLSGRVITPPDPFGEALYNIDPYLNISFRQPLPNFLCCRLAAVADFHNLLAQGSVPVTTRNGRALLVPSVRSFRGGLSVQF